MNYNITDAELVIMKIIWKDGDVKAMDIARIAGELRGWEKNTVYTMITRLIKKGIVERIEPGYVCHALVDEETYRKSESKNVVNKLFSGSFGLFARAFMDKNKLTNTALLSILSERSCGDK